MTTICQLARKDNKYTHKPAIQHIHLLYSKATDVFNTHTQTHICSITIIKIIILNTYHEVGKLYTCLRWHWIVFHQPPVNIGHLVQQPKQLHLSFFTKLTKIRINPNNVWIEYIKNNCLPSHCLQIIYNHNTT